MLQIFKISGDSLYPFYKNGERVVCRKVFKRTKIEVSNTVVFEKIKHIENNAYFVEGTNPYSIDSRNFGAPTQKELKYKVLFKL